MNKLFTATRPFYWELHDCIPFGKDLSLSLSWLKLTNYQLFFFESLISRYLLRAMKPSQDQCIEICDFAIAYLHDKFSNEKNLFRSGVSQTDVRTLQSQITQNSFSNKAREDFDPHLVAEVLITTLKDMPHPLLLDVYDDILATGICTWFF
jgi:hypothetical protein